MTAAEVQRYIDTHIYVNNVRAVSADEVHDALTYSLTLQDENDTAQQARLDDLELDLTHNEIDTLLNL